MFDVQSKHQSAASSALPDKAGGQRKQFHERNGAGGGIGGIVYNGVFRAENGKVGTDATALRVSTRTFVSRIVNGFDIVIFNLGDKAIGKCF